MNKLIARMSALFVAVVAVIVLFPLTAFGATFPVAVDETNFPDATWRAYVNANYAGGDSILTQAEAEAVTNISVASLGITDLTGVECFTKATTLNCSSNSLTSLDVTSLTNLVNLYCNGNSLTSLNVTGLTNLQTLRCYSNSLSSLDVAGLTSLGTLWCSNNSLTSLDATSLSSLQYLYCYNNSLTSVDVTGLTNLRNLYCYSNSITSLDTTGLTGLEILWCSVNALTSLDVTGLTSLVTLNCQTNSLLEVEGVSLAPNITSWVVDRQTRTIPMISDGSGGYVSTVSYPIETVNTLAGLDTGVSYDASTGLFYADTVPRTSQFTTTLSGGSYTASGTLTFSLFYAVTYDANGGSGTLLDPNSPYSAGAAVTILDNTFTAPVGKAFAEWNTSPDGTGTFYGASDTFYIAGDVTLYAQWEPLTFTVVFLDWDGTVLSSEVVEYGQAATAPTDPIRDGYTFTGWDTDYSAVVSDLEVTALFEAIPGTDPDPGTDEEDDPTSPNSTSDSDEGKDPVKVAEKSALAQTGDMVSGLAALIVFVIAAISLIVLRKKMRT